MKRVGPSPSLEGFHETGEVWYLWSLMEMQWNLSQTGNDPGECRVSEANGLQATEEDGEIDGIESCAEVEEENVEGAGVGRG